MDGQKPWKSMWLHPRNTIQEIIAVNPNRSLWLLATIYGVNSILNFIQSYPGIVSYGLIPVILMTLIVGPLWGYSFFAIWSWVLFKVGRLLNGKGTFTTIRSAYAWSCVPLVGSILIWLLLLTFFADFVFTTPAVADQSTGPVMIAFLLLIGKLVFGIWALILFLQTLSAVQQFSILRSIANVILSSLAIGIVIAIFWFIAMFLLKLTIPSVTA